MRVLNTVCTRLSVTMWMLRITLTQETNAIAQTPSQLPMPHPPANPPLSPIATSLVLAMQLKLAEMEIV
jgi:hypothetical protein